MYHDEHDADTIDTPDIRDCNGATLASGDSVSVIKELKVKGSSITIKQGTVISGIRLVAGEEEGVQCRIGGSTVMLHPQWLKKRK